MFSKKQIHGEIKNIYDIQRRNGDNLLLSDCDNVGIPIVFNDEDTAKAFLQENDISQEDVTIRFHAISFYNHGAFIIEKEKKIKKVIHIYHHFDADGYVSAAVIIRHFRNKIDSGELEVKTYSCKHNTPMNFDTIDIENDMVYIVDFSFTNPRDVESVVKLASSFIEYAGCEKEYDIILQLMGKMIWIDHHASSADLIENDKTGTLKLLAMAGSVHPENIFAGCMLTWLYFNYSTTELYDGILEPIQNYIEKNCPTWIRLVDDYDKWAHKMENSTAFVTALNSIHGGLYSNLLASCKNSFCMNDDDTNDNLCHSLIKEGITIDEYRKYENARALKNSAFHCTFTLPDDTTLDILAINRVGNSLIFGDYIKDVDAVVTYSFDGHLWNYSIFSHESKDYPVNKVAEMYKEKYGITGGGHKHAAGWATPVCIFDLPNDTSISKDKTPFREWVKEK